MSKKSHADTATKPTLDNQQKDLLKKIEQWRKLIELSSRELKS